jgi:hypothetical protein
VRVVPAGVEDAAKGVLEPEAILRPLPDLDVGEEIEERAAPVGPAPGRRAIEALVTGGR